MSAHLDGDLDARSRARVERHLAGCRRCTLLLASLRRTLGLLRDVGDTPSDPLPSVAGDVLRRIRRDTDSDGGR